MRRHRAVGVIALVLVTALLYNVASGQTEYDPKEDLEHHYPDMVALRKQLDLELTAMQSKLTNAEKAGVDTSCGRQATIELGWRLHSTSDVKAARRQYDRTVALMNQDPPPSARQQIADGSYGACAEAWWLRLVESGDKFLTKDWSGTLPTFLDRINSPDRLRHYLESILVSDIPNWGVNNRKELNEASSTLMQLILHDAPRGYTYHVGLKATLGEFIARWQDPETGFYGSWYRVNNRLIKKPVLSMTFHIASYGKATGHWPRLINTLLQIRDHEYPFGWLEDHKMFHHHNYDVVRLFKLGWLWMNGDQQHMAMSAIEYMLAWCENAISPSGEIKEGGSGDDSVAENYYTLVSFLDEIGYFKGNPFWDRGHKFPNATAVRERLLTQVKGLNQKDPAVQDTLEKLGN